MSGSGRSTRSAAAAGSPGTSSQFALVQPDESLTAALAQAQLDPAQLTQLLQAQSTQQLHQSQVIKDLHERLDALQSQVEASDSAPPTASPLAAAARLQQPQQRVEPPVARPPSPGAASNASTASSTSVFSDTLAEAIGEEADPHYLHDHTRRYLGARWQANLFGPRAKKHNLSVHELESLNLLAGVIRAWIKSLAIINAALAESADEAHQRALQDAVEQYYDLEPAMQLFVTEKTLKLHYPSERVEPVMEALRATMDVRDSSTSHIDGIPLALPDAGRTLAEFKTKEAGDTLRRFGTKAPTGAAKAAEDDTEAAELRRKLKTLQDKHATVKRDLLKHDPAWKPPSKSDAAKGTTKAAKAPKRGAPTGTPPAEAGGGP